MSPVTQPASNVCWPSLVLKFFATSAAAADGCNDHIKSALIDSLLLLLPTTHRIKYLATKIISSPTPTLPSPSQVEGTQGRNLRALSIQTCTHANIYKRAACKKRKINIPGAAKKTPPYKNVIIFRIIQYFLVKFSEFIREPLVLRILAFLL